MNAAKSDKVVLVCGDRNWTDYETILKYLKGLQVRFKTNSITIVEGACRRRGQRSADYLAGLAGKYLGYEVIPVKADWTIGDKAGPIRNQLMLDTYNPCLVAAFHNDIEHSRGTKNMLDIARRQGFETELITSFTH